MSYIWGVDGAMPRGSEGETMIATHQKQNLNDRIQVRAFGYMVAGVVTKVTDKAIEVTTDNTAGEWKQFSAKVWFPKSALVPVPEKRGSAPKKKRAASSATATPTKHGQQIRCVRLRHSRWMCNDYVVLWTRGQWRNHPPTAQLTKTMAAMALPHLVACVRLKAIAVIGTIGASHTLCCLQTPTLPMLMPSVLIAVRKWSM